MKLDNFINTWDAASLAILGSEFNMMSLMAAQKIIDATGCSVLDYLVFPDGTEINVPDSTIQESVYFKAPWE